MARSVLVGPLMAPGMMGWWGIAMPVMARRRHIVLLVIAALVVAALVTHRCGVLAEVAPVAKRCRGRVVCRSTGGNQPETEHGCDEKATHGVLLWDFRGGMMAPGSRHDQGRIGAVAGQDVTACVHDVPVR